MDKKKWMRRRKRLFEILEVGNDLNRVSRAYDYVNAFEIIVNLAVSIMYTYEGARQQAGFWLLLIEDVTIAFFV